MDQIQGVVRLIGEVLGHNAIGAYLHGSAVLGGLKPASDLDVLVVCRLTMDEPTRRALLKGLFGISGTAGAVRPVELTVVVRSEVRPWRSPPTGDFLYGEWLRAEFEAGAVPSPRPMPDLAVLITEVLAGDHPLTGPPPAHILDPVPHADLVAASVGGIPGPLDNLDGDTRNVVLTLARIWTTLATGEIRSKDAAADWALAHLPPEHRPVLEHAKRLHLSARSCEERWDDGVKARVRPHVDAVLAGIEGIRKL